MKKFTVLAVATIALVIALVDLVACRRHPVPEAVFEPRAPHHVFDAADGVPEIVPCTFYRVEKGDTLFRTWQRPLQPCDIGPGWTHPSEAGIRAFGSRPWIDVFSTNPELGVLVLTIKALPDPKADRRQVLGVFVNGAQIATREISTGWTTIGLDLPPGTLRRGTNRVEFSFAYRVSSHPGGDKKNDPRRFSVDLLDLTLTARTDTPRSERHLRRLVERAISRADSEVRVWNAETQRFRIDRPGDLILPMVVPPDTNRLAFEMNAPADLERSAESIDLTVRVVESGETWAPALPPWRRREGGRGLAITTEIPVARCAGVLCVVTVGLDPRPSGTTIEISQPEPLFGPPAGPTPTPPDDDPSPGTYGPPDIVLVILDAARYDHFSSSGYHRRTTPNIDRLADESLVFSSVFALAPYTMCSVPTMVSGLSFLEHGVTDRGRSLAPGSATLAAQLRDAGYRTVAFSTNPNNSRAVGTDQGYDEFFELWNEEEGHHAIDADFTTSRVLEKLAVIDDSRPLHLQVHYMPPHAPYQPPPEFDVFSDPGYDGPCDGSNQTINMLDAGRRDPGNGCLEQVIGLYDGGLLAADAAVGRLLDALRDRPQWRNTVVLVTSDHGEAFLEHGRTSHNSTVFDEMLHVPFVLRLPVGFDGSRADTGRLATLADIVPTLLATASLQPATTLEGKDLLRLDDFSRGFDDHTFVARTTGDTPDFGLRSTRWKMILAGSGNGALYNLEGDPGEMTNLGFVNRPFFVALGGLLTTRLATTGAAADAPSTALPESDREMLEALGYVE